jgi:hypothetical protein
VRAIIICLFLFSCTNDYVNTFWSKNEQVNRCFPLVKEYWESRNHTVHIDESGMEIVIVEVSDCQKGEACLKWDEGYIEMERWLTEYDNFCDSVAHEVGHGLGFDHEKQGIMRASINYTEPPELSIPVSGG